MILLTEVAKKLQDILNGANNPIDFQFVVATQGYHLDSISDHKTGKNTIPVFIGLSGGDHNAVPNLKQSSTNILVSLWFPVRFKEHFYLLDDFLEDVFVGKQINYGAISGTILSNISIAQYGELTSVDLKEYKEWVEETYVVDNKRVVDEIDVMEQYMSMQFTLYLSSLGTTNGEKAIFGNAITYKLKGKFNVYETKIGIKETPQDTEIFYDRDSTSDLEGLYAWKLSSTIYYTKTETPITNDKIYDDLGQEESFVVNSVKYEKTNTTQDLEENCIWTSSGTGKSITPLSQQLIDTDTYVKNVANITNYNKSIIVYVRENEFWKNFLLPYNLQDQMESLELVKTYNLGGSMLEFTYKQIALTVNENIALGEPLSFTIALGDE